MEFAFKRYALLITKREKSEKRETIQRAELSKEERFRTLGEKGK